MSTGGVNIGPKANRTDASGRAVFSEQAESERNLEYNAAPRLTDQTVAGLCDSGSKCGEFLQNSLCKLEVVRLQNQQRTNMTVCVFTVTLEYNNSNKFCIEFTQYRK